MRPWITFFSQTGNEIYNLTNALGSYPDAIITNKQTTDDVNKGLLELTKFRSQKLNQTIWYTIPTKPTVEDYKKVLNKFKNPIITLHGYLRIIPKAICDKYEIYNLHPGLINKYPELKGFNPQERAFKGKYEDGGCVIHKVTPGVDEGQIVASGEISLDGLNLADTYCALKDCALETWINFIREHKILESESRRDSKDS